MIKIVLIRHGQTTFNKKGLFCGWTDVDLTPRGRQEALRAGQSLSKKGFSFDLAFDSYLKRSSRTLALILKGLTGKRPKIVKDWRLNERHYGGLTGLDKAETAARHGEEQVKIWRRSYDTPPPIMPSNDPRHPSHDKRYSKVDSKLLPSSESLKDTVGRFLPLWHSEIAPKIKAGQKILIAAHGNSLRALIQYLENLTPAEIMEVNVPTGVPLLYKLDSNFKVVGKEFLGDAETVKAAMEAVAAQGKAKK